MQPDGLQVRKCVASEIALPLMGGVLGVDMSITGINNLYLR